MATFRAEADIVVLNNTIYYSGGYNTIEFKNTYTNPVVIVFMNSKAGTDPVVIRLRNITSTGCEIGMVEWHYNYSHNPEVVAYFVVEAGDFTLPDGTRIAAGTADIPKEAFHTTNTIDSSDEYIQIDFSPAFYNPPAFFASLQTYNNIELSAYYNMVSTGSMNVTETSAWVFQERSRYNSNAVAADEVVGWLAIDNFAAGSLPNLVLFETQRFNNGTDDGYPDTPRHRFDFVNEYYGNPLVFCQGNTLNNSLNGYWARTYTLTSEYLEPYACEYNNFSHTDEEFSLLAFSYPFNIIFNPVDDQGFVETRNVWTTDSYIYRPTDVGLEIFDFASETLINFVPFNGGVASVWADDDYAYAGTSISGVYRLDVTTVTGTPSLVPYKTDSDILSNVVGYVHGKGDYLCVATLSGVDRYNLETNEREYLIEESPVKCFQASNGGFYYYKNPQYKVEGLDGSVLEWKYVKVVTLSRPAYKIDYIYNFEIERVSGDDILSFAKSDGADIRMLDNLGNALPYAFEVWNGIDNPRFWVRLEPLSSKIYVLYGNPTALPVESPKDTFLLFDDFDSNELDEVTWAFEVGNYYPGYYEIENSIIKMVCIHNSYPIRLVSNKHFAGDHIIEAMVRVTDAANMGDMDLTMGFDADGVGAYIGTLLDTNENPLELRTNTDWGTVAGTKFVKTKFLQWSVTESLYYQSTTYDDEQLTASGTVTPSYRNIYIGFNNNSNNPDLEIEWIRVRNYDAVPPSGIVSEAKLVYQELDSPKLYAVYSTTSGQVDDGFTYTTDPTNVLRSHYINDLYVTEDTSTYGGNCILLATTWGAMVIEEKRGDETNCRKRIYLKDS